MFIINFNNIRFSVGDIFVFLIIVKDYGRKYIVILLCYFVYEILLGRVIVLVSFDIFRIYL